MKSKPEYKSFATEIKQVSDAGQFEAIIATLGVIDRDGDIIEPGAFPAKKVSIQPAHDSQAVPLGNARIEERGDKAVAVGKLNLDTNLGREWHSHLKFDMAEPPAIQEWSFGFMVDEAVDEVRDGAEVRLLKKLDVFEVSPVLLGAGIGTGTVAVKGKRLVDEIGDCIDSVRQLTTRVTEVAKLRQGKGRAGLSAERLEQLKALAAELEQTEQELQQLADAGRSAGADIGADNNGAAQPEADDADAQASDNSNGADAEADEMTPEEQTLADIAARRARDSGVAI